MGTLGQEKVGRQWWIGSSLQGREGYLIFVLAFLVRIFLLIATRQITVGGGSETINVAHSLLRDGSFANPFPLADTGPTAHVPPVYTYFLYFLLRLVGDGTGFVVIRKALTTAAAALQYALLPRFAEWTRLPRGVGVIAGLLGACTPIRLWTETSGEHETVYAGLALLVLLLISIPLWSDRQISLWRAAFSGVAWGFGILLSPALMLVYFGVLLASVVRLRNWHVVRSCCLAGVAAGLVLVPWAFRNYMVFHAFVPVRSNMGLELAVSNYDGAEGVETWENGPHPYTNAHEAEKMRDMGELAYYKERKQEGLAWIRAHQARFVQLTALRVWYFWFMPVYGIVKGFFFDALSIAAIAGLWLLFRARWPSALALLATWLLFPLPYYITHAGPRYRYPIDWTFCLTGVYCIWHIWRHYSQRQQGTESTRAAGATGPSS